MSLFKPKKQDRGEYTAFLSIKGEPKTSKGEQVTEEIKTGEKDPVTGLDIVKVVPVVHKYTTLNIVKNYPEGQEPADIKDKESYFFFTSSNTKEKDYICKDKETKQLLGEIDYLEEEHKFVGRIGDKKIYIPVADENDRNFQVYLEISDDECPF